MEPTFKVGDVLKEKLMGSNVIPWYKDQQYVIHNIKPSVDQYEIRGTQDNYPRFFTKGEVVTYFDVVRRAP
jgi:hypothetical protein